MEDPALEAGNGLPDLGRDRVRRPALEDGSIQARLADDGDRLLASKGTHRVGTFSSSSSVRVSFSASR